MNPLETFLDVYRKLDGTTLDLLKQIYDKDIHFSDPAHEIRGLANLKAYFELLYRNTSAVDFNFNTQHLIHPEAYIQWQMLLQHPRLNRGRTVEVDGISYLRFNEAGKTIRHRDYFDLGAMLYEQLPILGTLITSIKRRLGT